MSAQLPMDFRERIAVKAEEARTAPAPMSHAPRAASSPGNNGYHLRTAEHLPPETEDLCGACGKAAERYSAFRDGKVWRLVCRACHAAAGRPLGPVPCSGCNAPARAITMLNGRVICADCRVRA